MNMQAGNLAARMPIPQHGEFSELAVDLNSLGHMLESLARDEMVWDHHGEFGGDIVILKVEESTRSVHYLPLAISVLTTLVVFWFAVVRPGREMVRSWRSRGDNPLAL